MFRFISEAKKEFEHVVWPTSIETKKYMLYTVGVIVIMALLLAVVGYGLQTSLSALRTTLGMGKELTTTSTSETNTDLDQLLNTITVSGETESGDTGKNIKKVQTPAPQTASGNTAQ